MAWLSSARSGTGLLLLAVLAGCDRQAPDASQPAAAAATMPGAVDRSHKGAPAAAAAFQAPDGKRVTLAAFRGRPLLVNLWATWCAPCVAELPTLDRVAAAGAVRVVAVSQDMDAGKASPFLRSKRLTHLLPYRDPELGLSIALGGNLPTSIFYGADGRERWRVAGGKDWIGPEARALLAER